MKFNLKKLMKKAMGGPAYRYRDQIKWSKIEDVVSGTAIAMEDSEGSKTWAQLTEELPSLKGPVYEALKFMNERSRLYMARYNWPKEKMNAIFNVLMGYHPFYGCYVCSSGPYVTNLNYSKQVRKWLADNGRSGRLSFEELDFAMEHGDPSQKIPDKAKMLKADFSNRLSFFKKRYPRANPEEIRNSIHQFVYHPKSGLLSKFSKDAALSGVTEEDFANFNGGDFMMRARTATGIQNDPTVPKGGGEKVETRMTLKSDVFLSLDPNSEDGKRFFDRKDSPVLGSNSEISLNARGMMKLLEISSAKGNWGEIYNTALESIAKSMQITIEELKVKIIEDETFRMKRSKKSPSIIQQVVNTAHDIQQKMIADGNPMAKLMRPIPTFDAMTETSATAGRFDALKTTETQVNLAFLRKEILDTMVRINSNNPEAVAAALEESRNAPHLKHLKAKGKITPEIVKLFMTQLRKERGPGGKFKSIKQLQEEADKSYLAVIENKGGKVAEGFDDTETNNIQMSMYFYSPGCDAVDPKSKAKFSLLHTIPPQLLEDNVKITSDILTKFRADARAVSDETELLNKIPWQSPVDLEQSILKDYVAHKGKEEVVITEEDIRAEEEINSEIEALEDVAGKQMEEITEDNTTVKEEEKMKAGRKMISLFDPENVPEPKDVIEPEITDEDIEITEVPDQPVTEEPSIAPEITDQTVENAPVINQEEDFAVTGVPSPAPVPALAPDVNEVQQEVVTENPPPVPADAAAVVAPTQPQTIPSIPKKEKRKKTPKTVNTLGSTLISLIKIAKELDEKGKFDASEQIHKVIRKYQSRII